MKKLRCLSKTKVKTKVLGGIGNQLFCYFAGYHLAKKNQSILEVDISDVKGKSALHNGSIDELNIPGIFTNPQHNKIEKLILRVFRKIHLIFPRLYIVTRFYSNFEVGFDTTLDYLKPPISINGYFQSYRYVYPYLQELNPIKLKNESHWFKSTLDVIGASDFLSVHIRRGDYLNLANSYGLLDREYYLKGIQLAKKMGCTGRIVVFSDDIKIAKQMLEQFIDSDTVWIDPPINTSSVESLILMSLAKGNVIANSTFSWWGAALNKNQETVIAPSQWFKNKTEPLDLYPAHWRLVNSSWIP